jgi:hypothetical protein
MIKKISLLALLLVFIATSCNLGSRYRPEPGADQKGKVKEVIQTSNYTYLRVEKNNREEWIAIGKMDVAEGKTIYYQDGLEMLNFHSPELNRDFDRILFVQEISDEPITDAGMHGGMEGMEGMGGMMGDKPEKPVLNKIDVSIEQPEGGITIGDLYANRDQYAGKMVTVRGQVTKVNAGIMGRNWVHIQDGTSSGDYFDLTVTTDDIPEVGNIVTYSGSVILNKDFGYGYYYEVLLENAKVVKPM